MLETEATHDPSNYSEENCGPEDRDRLIHAYLTAVSLQSASIMPATYSTLD